MNARSLPGAGNGRKRDAANAAPPSPLPAVSVCKSHGGSPLTNKFVSVLETIGKDALKVVGAVKSPAEQEVLSLAEDFVPGLKPVVDVIGKIGTLVQGAEATAAVL